LSFSDRAFAAVVGVYATGSPPARLRGGV